MCVEKYEARRKDQLYCAKCRPIMLKKSNKIDYDKYRLRSGKKVGVGSGNNQGRGITHHTYKNGIGGFQKLKLDSCDWKCERCGVDLTDSITLKLRKHAVHHIDRNRANNRLENLDLLCKSCHQKEHHPPREGIVQDVRSEFSDLYTNGEQKD